jgi:hypothetical protein
LPLIPTDVSEELNASIIRVTRELGTTLAVRWRRQVPSKRQFLLEPRGVTSQKTPFFIAKKKQTNSVALSPRANYTD